VTFLGWLSDPFKGLSDLQRSGMKRALGITWWLVFSCCSSLTWFDLPQVVYCGTVETDRTIPPNNLCQQALPWIVIQLPCLFNGPEGADPLISLHFVYSFPVQCLWPNIFDTVARELYGDSAHQLVEARFWPDFAARRSQSMQGRNNQNRNQILAKFLFSSSKINI